MTGLKNWRVWGLKFLRFHCQAVLTLWRLIILFYRLRFRLIPHATMALDTLFVHPRLAGSRKYIQIPGALVLVQRSSAALCSEHMPPPAVTTMLIISRP